MFGFSVKKMIAHFFRGAFYFDSVNLIYFVTAHLNKYGGFYYNGVLGKLMEM